MKRIIFSLLVLLISISVYSTESKRFVVRISNPSVNDAKYFYNNNYDIASYNPGKYLDLVVTDRTYKNLLSEGYSIQITQTEQQLKNNLSSKPLSGYRSYDDMLSELQQIEADHPDICKLYDIGDSWGKIYSQQGFSGYDTFQQDIWLMKISDNVNQDEDEPNILYDGEHHAREPISMEMVMKIINHIVDNYGSDTQITNDVNSKQIWFIPLVNPNGHKLVWEQTNVWWRKNIRDNNGNHHIYQGGQADNQDGVDPNRNYGFEWGSVGTSDDWTSDVYHGPNAFSEPNIQAVRDFVCAHNIVASISYHSYSELVLFPLGYENNTTAPDHDALQDLATDMANTIPAINGGHYTPEESWQLYPCMGTSDDYFYGARGIFAYTIELGTEFIPDSYTMNQIVDNNVQAAMVLLDRVDNRVLTGHITDASTGLPLSAQIYVDGVDNTGVYVDPRKSDETFGRYYRLLLPGTYNVTFSKYGYESQTVSVNITNNSQTIRDISLQPVSNYVTFSGEIRKETDFLPISNAKVSLINTPLDTLTTNQNGIFNFEQVVPGTYTIQITKEGFTPIQTQIELNENTEMPFFMSIISGESFENGIPNDWTSHLIENQWFVTNSDAYDGTHSLRSNSISHNQSATFEFATNNLQTEGRVTFYYKVSSESGYDFLYFYIDNNIQGQWSGETGWQYASYTVPSGSHDLIWRYSKDPAVSDGDDCAWIDMVSIPGITEVPQIVVYPQEINIELPQNTTLDTLFSIFNNTTSAITSINISSNATWLTIPQEYQNGFDLPSYNGQYVDYNISTQTEGNYNTTIDISFGNENIEIPVNLTVENVSNDDNQIPLTTKLYDTYPNPFMPTIQKFNLIIKYQLAKNSKTRLTIYNLKGQLISKLIEDIQTAGKHSVSWNLKDKNGKKISSGIYFYKLDSNNKVLIKKITIIK